MVLRFLAVACVAIAGAGVTALFARLAQSREQPTPLKKLVKWRQVSRYVL
jgi:hypothetical protein